MASALGKPKSSSESGHLIIPDLNGLSGKPEFLTKDKTIIVFNDKITGQDVIQSLKPCIRARHSGPFISETCWKPQICNK